jgi:MFS family permease
MQGGMQPALVPLVMVAMNAVYMLSAYPFGKLADSVSHLRLLVAGLGFLVLADLVLAQGNGWPAVLLGVALWGLHMGMTQGLLAVMVAHTAPPELKGTAFGFFNLVSGIAMLLASAVAGVLWERHGAAATFYAGAAFSVLAALLVTGRARQRPFQRGV